MSCTGVLALRENKLPKRKVSGGCGMKTVCGVSIVVKLLRDACRERSQSELFHHKGAKRQRDKECPATQALCPFAPLSLCGKAFVLVVCRIECVDLLRASGLSGKLSHVIRHHNEIVRAVGAVLRSIRQQ